MTVGLDTSVVIRLLTGEPRALANAGLRYLRSCERSGDRVLVSDWVVAEAYHALQYHYRVSKPDALAALRQLFASGMVESSGDAAQVLDTPNLASAKPGFIDRVIHAHYHRLGTTEMATFEKAGGKLAGVLVLSA